MDKDKIASEEAAERLRARIEAEPWPHRAVTVSIGIAIWCHDSDSAAELIHQADQALYFSKQQGRNRATRFSELHAMLGPA